MKKILSLALIFSTNFIVLSQVLYQDNFESYTIGSIVPQTSFDYVNGLTNSFQVIQDVNNKNLRIDSPFSLSKNLNMWSLRDSGNDIIQVEFDYFTGPISPTLSRGGIVLYAADQELIGIMMHNNSKVVFAADAYWGVPIDELPLGIGDESVVLQPNTWVHLGFSLNTITKEAIFTGPGFSKSFQNYFQWNYPNFSIDYMHFGDSAYFYYDNVVVKAVSSSTLGGQRPFSAKSEIQLYPNPVTDFVLVKTTDVILEVYIYDVNGKKSEVTLNNGKIDVSQFPSGNYIMVLKTNNGFVSQKIIKR
jgi:Secretion system C-terminal sorting domain